MNYHTALHYLSTFVLAPFLLKQGKQVRKEVVMLPEPTGDRCGEKGEGKRLKLLILGDSAAAGVGASHQHQALSGQLVDAMAQSYKVEWQLIAKTGWRTSSILKQLDSLPDQQFDLIVTSLGVNDVTSGVPRSRWLHQQQALIQKLRTRFSPKSILLTAVPPMEEFTALPQPLRWYVGNRAAQLNYSLKQMLDKEPGCHLVKFEGERSPEYIASDGFHPSPAAYQLWANQLSETFANKIT